MALKENLDVLEMLIKELSGEKIELVLTAGTNLAYQGVDVPVNDLDLITNIQGMRFFEKRFKHDEVVPTHYKESEQIRSYFSVYKINGVTVELMALGEIKDPKTGVWAFYSYGPQEEFSYNGIKIRALTLQSELKAYIALGREEKAKLIQNRIERKWGFFPGVH